VAQKSDSHTRDRAQRLATLQAEAAIAFKCSDPPTTAEKHLIMAWSTLTLGLEVLSAKLVGGADVDATELIKLAESLASYMPKRKAYEIDRLEVAFVGQKTANLDGAVFDRFEALANRLDKVDTETDPQSLADALLTIEVLRREVEALSAKCAANERKSVMVDEPAEPQTLSIPDQCITPPRQLPPPSPSRADAESAAAWSAVLGHQPRPPSACWTESGGYYDPENR
jgi:hypothetical protein